MYMLYLFAPVIQVAVCHEVYQLMLVDSIGVPFSLKVADLYQACILLAVVRVL
jgi:hypothetical protein